MEPPIIAWEPMDMTIFECVEDAEAYLEPWMDDCMTFFDSKGRRLTLDGSNDGRVRIRVEDAGDEHESELRDALLIYLNEFGNAQNDLSTLPTDELIQFAKPHAKLPEPYYGGMLDFFVDFIRWCMGKPPLASQPQSGPKSAKP